MATREAGRILGDEVGLMPCLWIGISTDGTKAVPWYPGGRPPTEAVPLPNAKPGQFVLDHQYDGLACSHVTLCGAVLPLSTCIDNGAATAFDELSRRYVDSPFLGHWPDLDEIVAVRAEFLRVGPLDPTNHFRELGEAFLTFALSEETYDWLRTRFQMVTRIEDNDEFRPVRIAETGELPGDFRAFLDWMGGSGGSCYQTWVQGAFLYENSD